MIEDDETDFHEDETDDSFMHLIAATKETVSQLSLLLAVVYNDVDSYAEPLHTEILDAHDKWAHICEIYGGEADYIER